MAAKDVEDRFSALVARVRALEGKSPTAKESWLKRNAYWFFPSLALFVGSGLIALVAGSFVDNRIEAKLANPLERLRKVEDGILRIETKLDSFVNALLAERLRAATVTPHQFRDRLADVNASLRLANETNTKIEHALAEEIKAKLQQVPASSTLNYWQTVGTFVTQQTVIAKGMSLEQALNIPSCTPPSATYKGLHIVCKPGEALDVDGWTFKDSKFVGTLIRYRGKAPALFINTTFIDCNFLLVLPAQPQLQLQMLASSILKNPNLVEFK